MRERDPMNWSVPLPWRPLGVTVRVHILFPCVALGVVLWVATSEQFAPGLWAQACAVLTILFVAVLLHEFGHVIAARRVDGDIAEIVLWPLGGLAAPDLPRRPGAHAFTAMGGPVVNLSLALLAGAVLVGLGFVPPLNPLASPLNPRLYSWKEGITYFSAANPGQAEMWRYDDGVTGQAKQVEVTFEKKKDGRIELRDSVPPVTTASDKQPFLLLQVTPEVHVIPAKMPRGLWLLAQLFLVNWVLFVEIGRAHV